MAQGKPECRGNYRGVTLLSYMRKLYAWIVVSKALIPKLERMMPDTQAGGRKKRGTTDNLLILRQLQSITARKRLPFCAAFLDLEKAFDRVPRNLLFRVLEFYGVSEATVRRVRDLYTDTACSVRVGGRKSRTFDTKAGVQQGAFESTHLFNAFLWCCLEPIVDELGEVGIEIEYRTQCGKQLLHTEIGHTENLKATLSNLMFVDDTALLVRDPKMLQPALDLIEKRLVKFGMKVNARKCVCINFGGSDALPCGVCKGLSGARESFVLCDGCDRAFHRECLDPVLTEVPDGDWFCIGCGGASTAMESVLHPVVHINGTTLRWESEFVYLGVLHESTGLLNAELNKRIVCASSVLKSLDRVFLHRGVQQLGTGAVSQLFNAVVGSVLLYGSDVWNLTAEQTLRLETFRRRCLRRCLKGRRNTSGEKYENVRIPPVATLLRRRQLRFVGHLLRCDEERLVVAVLSAVRRGGHGITGPDHLTDVYRQLMRTYLTKAARKEHFSEALPDTYARAQWHELAQCREAWRGFANST